MSAFLFLFIVVSAIGFIVSLIVHALAFFGFDLGLGEKVFALHFGLFAVWLPAVFMLYKNTWDFSRREIWKATFRGCPGWMRTMAYGLFGYAIVNLIFGVLALTSYPPHSSEASLVGVRLFSGHWMAFYFGALAILYSATRFKEVDDARRCPNGHKVSPLAKYCEECGATVVVEGIDGS